MKYERYMEPKPKDSYANENEPLDNELSEQLHIPHSFIDPISVTTDNQSMNSNLKSIETGECRKSENAECIICAENGATIVCPRCSNSFHLQCLRMTYQTKSKHILNGRCPYCTNALPINLRVQLENIGINQWLKEAIIEDDRVMYPTRMIDRETLASAIYEARTNTCEFDSSQDRLSQFLNLDSISRMTSPSTIMKTLLKLSEKFVIEKDEINDFSLFLDEPSMEHSDLEDEHLPVSRSNIPTCPLCDTQLVDDECKNCHKKWKQHDHIYVSCDRWTFETLKLSDELFDEIEYMSYSELKTFINKCFVLLGEGYDELQKLVRESIKPLAYSTLELTPNAALFVPLERKRVIARHAYLSMNRYRLTEVLRRLLYPPDIKIHLFDLGPTVEEIDEELKIIDKLIIETSFENHINHL